jgi:hypothetical protein
VYVVWYYTPPAISAVQCISTVCMLYGTTLHLVQYGTMSTVSTVSCILHSIDLPTCHPARCSFCSSFLIMASLAAIVVSIHSEYSTSIHSQCSTCTYGECSTTIHSECSTSIDSECNTSIYSAGCYELKAPPGLPARQPRSDQGVRYEQGRSTGTQTPATTPRLPRRVHSG